eukprot:6184037-Prymnesium_polylepis.1
MLDQRQSDQISTTTIKTVPAPRAPNLFTRRHQTSVGTRTLARARSLERITAASWPKRSSQVLVACLTAGGA